MDVLMAPEEISISTSNAPVTYEMLRKIGAELVRNSSPLSEMSDMPKTPPSNERHLVSRNNREGWYIGQDWKNRSRRSKDFRLGQQDPNAYILLMHSDAVAYLKRRFK